MTLPASGTISPAQIAAELNDSFPITIPNNAWRSLAGKSSGSIVIPTDFYSKSRMANIADGLGFGDTVSGSITLSSLPFGEAGVADDGGRRMYACVCWVGVTGNEALISSATIGGAAATSHAGISRSSAPNSINIGSAIISAFPTGSATSGDVVINLTQSDARSVAVFLYRSVSMSVTQGVTANATHGAGAQSVSNTLNVSEQGCVLIAGSTLMTGLSGAGDISFGGATGIHEAQFGSNTRVASAMSYQLSAQTGRTVSVGNNVPSGQTGLFTMSALALA